MKKLSVLCVFVAFISMSFLLSDPIKEKVHAYDTKALCDAPLVGSGYTGAPGNTTCAQSGCHSGGVNNGPGEVTFDIENGVTDYTPGASYTMTITMQQSGVSKFGFQTTSRKVSDNSFIGSNTLLETTRTRLITGGQYVATNACGSDATVPDSIEWTYEWTAPTIDEGPITLYLATIATNHNHSSSGDDTYTTSMTLGSATGLDDSGDLSSLIHLQVFLHWKVPQVFRKCTIQQVSKC